VARTFDFGTGTAFDREEVPPIAEHLDWRLEAYDPEAGTLRLSFPVKPEFLNRRGVVQGGMVCAMLDSVMGLLVGAKTEGKLFPSSTDLHVQFLRPASGARLLGEARITRMGRRAATTYAEIVNEAGKPVATALQTAMLLDLAAEPRG